MGKRKRYGERIKIKKTLFAFFFFIFELFSRREKNRGGSGVFFLEILWSTKLCMYSSVAKLYFVPIILECRYL